MRKLLWWLCGQDEFIQICYTVFLPIRVERDGVDSAFDLSQQDWLCPNKLIPISLVPGEDACSRTWLIINSD